jgi:pyruvate/2-oxoglutarate dehydrogenase complex dihydrolipoamide acyltransferase (E2) component
VQDVTIPALGMAMTGAVLTRWYKEPGETVAAGEVIAEIETDKSAVDLESPAAGVLGPHLVAEGTEVPVGGTVTRVLDSTTENVPADAVPAQAGTTTVTAPSATVVTPLGNPDAGTEVGSAPDAPAVRAPHKLSPRKRMAARLAAEAAAAAASPAAAAAPPAGGLDLTGRRAAVAQAVAESWRTIPHFSVQREIDCSEADASLAELRAEVPEATYTDLLLRAFALAVGTVMESSGDLGLAVATPDGVMMPVVPDVPSLAAPGLVAARIAAARRGREGRLTERDLASNAIAAVSNLGARGVDAFTGIVPAGRRLLLTTGRIAARPVAIDGRLAVRPTVIATLNVDHRYLDGDGAADVLDALDREFRALGTWAGKGNQ